MYIFSSLPQISHNPVLRAVYKRHIAPYKASLPDTDSEVLNMPCVRHNYAAIDLKNILPYHSNKVVCDLQEVPKASLEIQGSMIIRKKSPYLGILKRT
jgi:hypothetical protein